MPDPIERFATPTGSLNTSPEAADRMPVQADVVNPREVPDRSANAHAGPDAGAAATTDDGDIDAAIDQAGLGRFGRRPGDVVDEGGDVMAATGTPPGETAAGAPFGSDPDSQRAADGSAPGDAR